MPNENNELPLDVEAQLEEAESEATQKAILKRGLASLRGTRRSVNMTPREDAASEKAQLK